MRPEVPDEAAGWPPCPGSGSRTRPAAAHPTAPEGTPAIAAIDPIVVTALNAWMARAAGAGQVGAAAAPGASPAPEAAAAGPAGTAPVATWSPVAVAGQGQPGAELPPTRMPATTPVAGAAEGATQLAAGTATGPRPALVQGSGTAAAAGAAAAVQGSRVALVGAREGDEHLLGDVLGALAKTPTGQAVLQRIGEGRRPLRVQFQEAGEMSARAKDAVALYSHEQDTVYLSRATAAKDAAHSAIELSHEATHWLHDDLLDRSGFATLRDPAARAQVSLATETEAFMVMSRVTKEMDGFRLPAGSPGVRPDGSLATFDETWRQLAATDAYNPGRLQLSPAYYQRVLTQ
jgi:hypothetical protein